MPRVKQYLGDGVYIEMNDYGFTLTTEDGVRATNTIMLEPEVAHQLAEYITAELNLQQRLEEEGL